MAEDSRTSVAPRRSAERPRVARVTCSELLAREPEPGADVRYQTRQPLRLRDWSVAGVRVDSDTNKAAFSDKARVNGTR